MRVWDEIDHYILITSEEEDYVRAFDPYYQTEKFSEGDIEIVTGKLFSHNRIIPKHYFDSESLSIYAMGTAVNREALLFNRDEQTNFASKEK